jgi:two-component system nitrogen regulation response regulator GlnG
MRRGRFEQADGGTLFLDEIGDMPPELQTRLLRVLAEGEFYRVGGHTPIKVDVRIITATHQNLEKRVESGDFREDLFHRLNVIRIHIPPLRERREDIPALLRYFLGSSARELNVESKKLSRDAEEFMVNYDWPGNVRQLENTARWLMVMASGQTIMMDDLPPEMLNQGKDESESEDWQRALQHWAEHRMLRGGKDILDAAMPAFERIMINAALKQTGGRKQEAAKLLGWGRNTLTRKIKELHMEL